MSDFVIIMLRTVLVYFMVFFSMRLMGKREIGKLSVFDLVISIMVAEIAVLVLEDADSNMMYGIGPMILLVLMQIFISYITLKNRKLRQWFDGRPSILMRHGKLDREEMKKQRYSLDDLMLQLRERNVTNLADVEFAVLETSGKLSIIERSPHTEPKQSPDGLDKGLNQFRYEALPIPLIMDGKVQDRNLETLGKNRFWLKNELQQKGVRDYKEVFLCTIDHKGRLYVDANKRN